ncbi:MAG: hypothetical protein F4164_08335 [Gemmatimonadales bacterium]|nr:hypothetical protein [Gemmatimonadales bacterium]MYG49360.1 hypothetical protein [Gemmatimonadales bacterium]MYK03117.1 hypothetical protein [Candidatus Palauibacter ramosifaciens]
MTERSFEGYPNGAYHQSCDEAVSILQGAHGTASYLAEVFDYLEMHAEAADDAQQAEFAAQNEELLRAMLIFAGSGLDAMIKQLVQDALADVINLRNGAQERFRRFVEKRLKRGDGPDYSFVAGVIADPDPRLRLVGDLVDDLTSRSLQSVDEILSVGSYFDIPSPDLIPEPEVTRNVFSVRNQIIHEMDIDFTDSNKSRRSRRYADMAAHTQELFNVASRFLTAVDAQLNGGSITTE